MESGVKVGDIVYTIDRSRFQSAMSRDQAPEPLAAVVARILRDKEGLRTGQVCLCIIEPNGATLPALDVPYSPELQPGHWSYRPSTAQAARFSIPFDQLLKAVQAALEIILAQRAEAAKADGADVDTPPKKERTPTDATT